MGSGLCGRVCRVHALHAQLVALAMAGRWQQADAVDGPVELPGPFDSRIAAALPGQSYGGQGGQGGGFRWQGLRVHRVRGSEGQRVRGSEGQDYSQGHAATGRAGPRASASPGPCSMEWSKARAAAATMADQITR